MKVYIATTGDYSDYRIDKVFSTREKADEYAARWPENSHGQPFIEEWDVDDSDEFPPRLNCYTVTFDRDGNCDVERCAPEPPSKCNVVGSAWRQPDKMETCCWARHEKHAAKIANERRVQIIAADNWGAGHIEL